ncbi:MAG TPA: ribosome maturation factor RimM [Xanthobacteraceae bacterium]|nr:ribosome maturation factor RimM [Xanthobacteraceae bacterium]
MSERICVAQIGGAHGIRGEVKLKSFTADPMAVTDYGPLESEDGAAHFTIEAVRPAKGHLVVRFRGVDDRNAAERLTNTKLFVPRERLPPADDDEFYHADLIGLSAVTADGSAVGTVVAIHDFGAGDILELRPPGGGTTIMLPFTDAFVPDIDVAGGRIVVAPPAETAAKREGPEGSG